MPANQFFESKNSEIEQLAASFPGYVVNIDSYRIRDWIRQFHPEDYGLALKVLKNVNYFSPAIIARELKSLYSLFSLVRSNPLRNTYFATLSAVGSGADHLIPTFRLITGTKAHKYDSQFIRVSDTPLLSTKRKASLVLIEDFVGSGDTVVQTWNSIASIVPKEMDVYLLVVAGFYDALNEIERETRLQVIRNITLSDANRMFHPSNRTFSPKEKTKLMEYCYSCGAEGYEEGYKQTQSLLVLYYRISDNVIPILWNQNEYWRAIFPRYL